MVNGARESLPVTSSDARVEEELAQHEAMLAVGSPAVRVAVVRDTAVSFGVAVREDVSYLVRARQEGLSTTRRSTGGTGVLHLPGDLLWAVVRPRSDPTVGRDFSRAYGRLGKGVVRGLARLGLMTQWEPAPGLVDEVCTLSSRGEVLVVEDAIVGGAAQHATSRALLHHGGISWRVEPGTLDRLFALAPGGPSRRLGGLAERLSPAGPQDVARALATALRDDLGG